MYVNYNTTYFPKMLYFLLNFTSDVCQRKYKKNNTSGLKWDLYLAVTPFSAHLSIHALLLQGGRNAKAVSHAEYFCTPITVVNLYCTI